MPEPTPAEDLVNDVGPDDAVKVADRIYKNAFLSGAGGGKERAKVDSKFAGEVKKAARNARRT